MSTSDLSEILLQLVVGLALIWSQNACTIRAKKQNKNRYFLIKFEGPV